MQLEEDENMDNAIRNLVQSTYNTGNPVQFPGSKTFSKEGIPSVCMAPIGYGENEILLILTKKN